MAQRFALGLVLGVAVGALPACPSDQTFACTTDVQCVSGTMDGMCEPEGVCSFPDFECPSGKRYSDLAGELSGQCVAEASSTNAATDEGATSVAPGDTLVVDGSSSEPTASTTSTTTPVASTSDATTNTSMDATTDATAGPDPTGDPYGPCSEDADCTYADSYCHVDEMLGSSVCVPFCSESGDCPLVQDHMVEPWCGAAVMEEMGCVLLCNGTGPNECPRGMICELIMDPVGYCAWPGG